MARETEQNLVPVALPTELSPEMEATWRNAFIRQGHLRRGRGVAGQERRRRNPESCEAVAYRALVKFHGEPVAAPPAPSSDTGKMGGDGWAELSPDDQFAMATRIAANVGYELTPEPEHPDSPHAAPVSGGEGEAVVLEDVAAGNGRMTVVSMLAAVSNAISCIRASKFGRGAFYEKEHDKRADELNRARNRLIEALNAPSDPSATERMRAALETIYGAGEEPELSNGNTNDLLAREFWNIARAALGEA